MAISNSILNKYNKLAETALSDLILDHEILGFTALAMGGIKIVDNSIHPALAWTDYKNIYINAELAEQHGLNGEHIKFLIGHETLHPILLSHLRRGDKDPELWNQATDYAINALLINEGKCCNKRSTGLFIEGGCYKAEFSDMTAEQIYDYLKQHPEENEQPTLPLDFHLDDGDGKGSYEDADGNIPQDLVDLSALTTTQNVKYQDCIKVFNVDNVSLLHLTIASINANRFRIDEIQSRSGYVLFTAAGKQFLASISNVNTNQGMLKITPVDDNYYFQPGIVTNIFKYIELNLKTKLETIN